MVVTKASEQVIESSVVAGSKGGWTMRVKVVYWSLESLERERERGAIGGNFLDIF